MDDSAPMIEAALCALLRGEPAAWPESDAAAFAARLQTCAAVHGVDRLLSRQLSQGGLGERPLSQVTYSARDIHELAVIELSRKHQLVCVLNALADCDVNPLLLKGAALGYWLYPSPLLRPRGDTDLLIRSAERTVVNRVLTELGYEKLNAISGEIVTYQCGYATRDRFGIDHLLDLHWRISNTQLFARAFDYEELKSRSIPIGTLGEHARGLSLADALLHACMHRAHHLHSAIQVHGVPRCGGDRLIWLYDIHLLVGAMSSCELAEFAGLAEQKAVRAICRDALLRARQCFNTEICHELLTALARPGPFEPSAAHLLTGSARHLMTELRSLPRWRDRATLLREHLFPSGDYIREKYAATGPLWLPVLYLKRVAHGTWKRIQNP